MAGKQNAIDVPIRRVNGCTGRTIRLHLTSQEGDRSTVWKGSKNYKTCMSLNSITPHSTREQGDILRVFEPQYRKEATTQMWDPTNGVRVLPPIPFRGSRQWGYSTTNVPRLLPKHRPSEQTYTGGMGCINASHRYRPRVPKRGTPGSTSGACGLRTLGQDFGQLGYALRNLTAPRTQ